MFVYLKNALLTLELEEISTRVSIQAETIDELKKELDTLKLERDQLIKSIHSLENQNLENQIEIQVSKSAVERIESISFHLFHRIGSTSKSKTARSIPRLGTVGESQRGPTDNKV